ncbi:MAG TPA: DUF222 domain-containing protein [Acidimicrobiales bacterium]|nr:DUF222 domain-containing protein [Acidimicrobiales bacterium]
MPFGALAEAVDTLVGADPRDLADPGSIEELHRQLSRLDAVVTAAMAAFDTSGAWAADGARNAPAWLAARLRAPRAQMHRRVRLGSRLGDMPETAAAWRAGEVQAQHVEALSAQVRPDTAKAFERDEAMLVGYARTLRFDHFARALAYWAQLADPEGAEADAARQRSRRDVYLRESLGGMWLGQVTLDPVSGGIVAAELERLEAAEFDEDRAEAAARLGRDPLPGELRRTPGQRRADALVEMATRSRGFPADGRRPAPLFSVLVDFPTMRGRICELAQGTVVTPGSLVPWLEAADVERAVFTPGGRVEVGPAVRLFSGATRRAIELRDRECAHPCCDRPAHLCQVDHIVPWSEGGPTTQENGRLLCPFHNRLRNTRPPPPLE